MQELLPAILFGLLLIVIGGVFMLGHVAAIRKHREEDDADEQDREYFEKQYRRRMQTSGMIILMGLLIPGYDLLFLEWRPNPLLSTIALIPLFLIPAWIVLMAFGDMFSNNGYRMRTKAKLEEIRFKQKQLEEQANELRRQSNGHPHSRN